MVETLVLHVRDPKDLIQVSMEDSASAIGSPENMVAANTPASRIRLERFGKSSIALARCTGSENGPPPDQSAYEPLFRSASEVLADYRSCSASAAPYRQNWRRFPDRRHPRNRNRPSPPLSRLKKRNDEELSLCPLW